MSLISEIKFMYVCIKEVFESLEKVDEPTLQLVVPSYYLLQRKFAAGLRDCNVIQVFRSHLRKYLDQKFWSSVTASLCRMLRLLCSTGVNSPATTRYSLQLLVVCMLFLRAQHSPSVTFRQLAEQ